jgi:hypothetical protein
MYRSLALLLAALFAPLGLGAPVPKGGEKSPAYFPTQKGAKWTYATHRNDEEETETFVVTEVVEKGGEKIISVGRELKSKVTPAGTFKLTKQGAIESVGISQINDLPLSALDRPVKPGDVWEVDTIGPGKVPVKWKRAVRGPEKVKIPAGTFEAIRVEHTFTIKGDGELPDVLFLSRTEWYAPGVGLIRVEGEGKELEVLKSFTPGKD